MEQPNSPSSPYEDNIKAVKYISKSRHCVYLAINTKSKQHFALKSYFYENEEINSNFLQEARMKSIMHENIISILDSKKKKHDQYGHFFSYNLMELCPFSTVGELFAQSRAFEDVRLVRTIFRQIASGVDHLHKNGISHMDLKLTNLMFGAKFTVKVIDFEFAHFPKDQAILGKGTPGFRAPELRFGNCINPKAADVFSLGIILFALYTGCHPYTEGQEVEGVDLEEMVLNQDPNFWVAHSKLTKLEIVKDEEFKKLFWSMVKRNPSERIKIEDMKKSEWFNRQFYSKQDYETKMSSYYKYY
jgi:serine/threonine protein kinase